MEIQLNFHIATEEQIDQAFEAGFEQFDPYEEIANPFLIDGDDFELHLAWFEGNLLAKKLFIPLN